MKVCDMAWPRERGPSDLAAIVCMWLLLLSVSQVAGERGEAGDKRLRLLRIFVCVGILGGFWAHTKKHNKSDNRTSFTIFSKRNENKIHLTRDTWHRTHETWQLTSVTWHRTCDTWWRVNILWKFQLPSSYGLCVMMFWRFEANGSVKQWINKLQRWL